MRFFRFVFVFSLLLGCGEVKKDPSLVEQIHPKVEPKKTELPKSETPKTRYTINFPKGWTVEYDYQGTSAMAMSQTNSQGERAVINVVVVETKAKSADDFFEDSRDEYMASILKGSEVSNRSLTLRSGLRAHDIIIEGELSGNLLTFRALFATKGGFGFIVTSVSHRNTFEGDNKAFFEPSFQSFTLHQDIQRDVTRKYYSIVYPKGWSVSDSINWADSVAMSAHEKGEFTENIAVAFELAPGLDLTTYFKLSLASVKQSTKGFNLLSSELSTLENGRKVYEIIYTAENNHSKSKMIFDYQSNMGFLLILAATPKSFDKFEPIFDTTVDSFKILRKK